MNFVQQLDGGLAKLGGQVRSEHTCRNISQELHTVNRPLNRLQ
jgi:hypothetical protein